MDMNNFVTVWNRFLSPCHNFDTFQKQALRLMGYIEMFKPFNF
jgi:hypothetical protein